MIRFIIIIIIIIIISFVEAHLECSIFCQMIASVMENLFIAISQEVWSKANVPPCERMKGIPLEEKGWSNLFKVLSKV